MMSTINNDRTIVSKKRREEEEVYDYSEEDESSSEEEDDSDSEVHTSDEEEEEKEPAVKKAKRDRLYDQAIQSTASTLTTLSWKVDDQFEFTQNDTNKVRKTDHDLVSPPHGTYLVVHVGPKDVPTYRVDSTDGKMQWEINTDENPTVLTFQMYSTCLWLGPNPSERLAEFNQIRHLPHSPQLDAEWCKWLHIFLLPRKDQMHGRVMYVDYTLAASIEHYVQQNRIKGKSKEFRWKQASANDFNMMPTQNTWELVFPPALFQSHLRFVKQKQRNLDNRRLKNTIRPEDKQVGAILDETTSLVDFRQTASFLRDRPLVHELLNRYHERLCVKDPNMTLDKLNKQVKHKYETLFPAAVLDPIKKINDPHKQFDAFCAYVENPVNKEYKHKLDHFAFESNAFYSGPAALRILEKYRAAYQQVNKGGEKVDADSAVRG